MPGLSLFEGISSRAYLEVNSGQCLRLRHKKSSCRLCLESCPCGAISIDESLHVESSLCPGCGICVNVCPTGVFELRDLAYKSLLGQVREGTVVEFDCSWSSPSHQDGLSVPCLGYLNEAVLTGATIGGSQAVRLNVTPQCKKCRFNLGLRLATKSMKRANRVLALFGLPKMVSASAKETGDSLPNPQEGQLCSRREFFSYLHGETRSRVAAAIKSVDSDQAISAKVTLEPRLPQKRSLLLEHIKKLGQPVTDRAVANDLPFIQVEIHDDCDGCGRCVTFCPTGALRSHNQGDRQVIDFRLGYCLACGLCADICPQGAIAYSASINPGDLVNDGKTILVAHSKSTCARCGQTYITVSGNGLCLNCQKEKEMEEWLTRMWP